MRTPALLALVITVAACTPDAPRFHSEACLGPSCMPKAVVIPLEFDVLAAADGGGAAPDAASFGPSEPVWFTRSVLAAASTGSGLQLGPAMSTWRTVRWEVTENLLVAHATTDDAGAPLTATAQPALFTFHVDQHFDPRREPACNFSGDLLSSCGGDALLPAWPARPAMRLDLSQNLTPYPAAFLDAAGRALVAMPVSVYINNPDDPNVPVARCGAATCGDLDDPTQQLTEFDVTHRYVVAAAPATELTVRTTFARAPF